MSKIAISGAATGTATFTIESPATSTNRTITIPDATTTLVGTDATQTLTNKTLTTPNIDSAQFATVSGTAPLYACRAWVNFNGTGTVAIREDGNVTSITDNGTGDYTVNFTTAMPDANYCFAFGVNTGSGADGCAICQSPSASPTVSAFRIVVGLPGSISGGLTSNLRDIANICVSIFR